MNNNSRTVNNKIKSEWMKGAQAIRKKTKPLFKRIDDLFERLPERHRPSLGDQMSRSANSIKACISEGIGRQAPHQPPNTLSNYLHMSKGEAVELISHLEDAHSIDVLSNDEFESLKRFLLSIHDDLKALLDEILPHCTQRR